MPISTAQIQQFTRVLNAELESAQQLDKILDKEHRALTSSDPEQILMAADEKQHQMQETLRHLTERNRLLQGLNLSPGNRGMEQLLTQLPDESPVIQIWQGIDSLARSLKQKNETNGGIISLAQRHTRQALDILSGKIYASDTYGPSGERQSGPTTPPIGKA